MDIISNRRNRIGQIFDKNNSKRQENETFLQRLLLNLS
jgi:hypothetical protein